MINEKEIQREPLLSDCRFRSSISSITAIMVTTPANTDIAMIGTSNGFDSALSLLSTKPRHAERLYFKSSWTKMAHNGQRWTKMDTMLDKDGSQC